MLESCSPSGTSPPAGPAAAQGRISRERQLSLPEGALWLALPDHARHGLEWADTGLTPCSVEGEQPGMWLTVMELFRLEKTSKTVKSNQEPGLA